MKNKNIRVSNILPQAVSSCLVTMDIFLQQPYPVLSSIVVAKKHKSANDGNKVDFLQMFANILGIENIESKNLNDSLDKLGIDSLGHTEIKQVLEQEFDIVLSFREIYALTIGQLRDLIVAKNVSRNSCTN